MLKRVESETAVVERAVADLQKVNADLDKDFVVRLKRGGLVKQAALAGLILFAVRSIVDSVAAVGGDGDASAHLTAALVQAAVAVACAAIFFVV